MFDVGLSEWMVIAIVALVVLGPERLPQAARLVGRVVRRVRSHWSSLRHSFEQELEADQLRQELERIRRTLAQVDDQLQLNRRLIDPQLPPRHHPVSTSLEQEQEEAGFNAAQSPPPAQSSSRSASPGHQTQR